jgi:transglycosylase-like protein with SLT domain
VIQPSVTKIRWRTVSRNDHAKVRAGQIYVDELCAFQLIGVLEPHERTLGRSASPVTSFRVRSHIRPVAWGVAVALLAAGCSQEGATDAPSSITEVSSSTTTAPTVAPAPASTTTVAPLGSPAGIADALIAGERGIRDISLSADETARWGRAEQRAYRALSEHPEWDDTVRGKLPDDVRAPFDLNVAARRAVTDNAALHPPSDPLPTLPAWTIVAPLPVDELLSYYKAAEAATGVPWAYLAAINMVETRFGRIVGPSSAGAVGPMQFLPSTWASCCVGNVLEPRDAIMGAAVYLASKGAATDMRRALLGYNPNDGYVGAVEAYAMNLLADERALFGYHAWEVYVGSAAGTVRLPVGYYASQPIDAASYVAAHPEDLAPVAD